MSGWTIGVAGGLVTITIPPSTSTQTTIASYTFTLKAISDCATPGNEKWA